MLIEIGNVFIDSEAVEAITDSSHSPVGSYIVLKSGRMIECTLAKDEVAKFLEKP